jgi:methylated-DNA-[protein]-cysteine S-methyltransferase
MASLGTRQILYADRLESTIGTLLLIHDREGHVRALDFHDFESRMRRLLRLHYFPARGLGGTKNDRSRHNAELWGVGATVGPPEIRPCGWLGQWR